MLFFVFGGSHPGLWEKSYEAYNKGFWNYGDMAEADVIANNLIKLGVPERDILIEDKSIHSLENILFGMKKINLQNKKGFYLFVRVMFLEDSIEQWENIPDDIELIPYVFNTNISGTEIITKDNWFENEKSKALVFGEYLRIICYGNFGHLVSIEDPIDIPIV